MLEFSFLLVENYEGTKQRKVCEKKGGVDRRRGEEVWTRDKEARGREEKNKRYLDTFMRDGDVH